MFSENCEILPFGDILAPILPIEGTKMSDSSSESEREIDERKDGGDSDSDGGEEEEETPITFAELGPEDNRLAEVLCDAAASMGWKAPSKIQGGNRNQHCFRRETT